MGEAHWNCVPCSLMSSQRPVQRAGSIGKGIICRWGRIRKGWRIKVSGREEVTLELGLNSPVGFDKPSSWLERSIEVPSTAVEEWVVDLGS